MKLIKRNGSEVIFDQEKIYAAISKANMAVDEMDRISEREIRRVTDKVTKKCEKLKRAVSVEEVQDLVEREIMAMGAFVLAKTYITYSIYIIITLLPLLLQNVLHTLQNYFPFYLSSLLGFSAS